VFVGQRELSGVNRQPRTGSQILMVHCFPSWQVTEEWMQPNTESHVSTVQTDESVQLVTFASHCPVAALHAYATHASDVLHDTDGVYTH
jgi:hypothetical protein